MKTLIALLISLSAGAATIALMLWLAPEVPVVAGALGSIVATSTELPFRRALGRVMHRGTAAREHGPAGGA